MLEKGTRFLRTLREFERINMSLTRGQIARSSRHIDMTIPATWEFSGFSQNGEDGIIEILLDHLIAPNRYFIEIGSSDGLENNTCWLSLVHRYSGLWVEADPLHARRSLEIFGPLNHGLQVESNAVTPVNAGPVLSRSRVKDPDLLSLDIDSYDYFVAEAILAAGFRPQIFVLEYNSAFGPDSRFAVQYSPNHSPPRSPADKLSYGSSLSALKALFARNGYRFLTVERNGVNAFFVDASRFVPGFLESVHGIDFAENYAQLVSFPGGWKQQWQLISNRSFATIEAAP